MWQHRAGRVEISFLNDSISGATMNPAECKYRDANTNVALSILRLPTQLKMVVFRIDTASRFLLV